ncbi:unnamed protein product, partial [Didymodactylos carnosus]
FLLIRCCCLSLIILFVVQILTFYQNKDNNQTQTIRQQQFERIPTTERLFWTTLAEYDRQNFDEQKRLKLILKHQQNVEYQQLNWTKILYDSYKHKLATLNERDKTINTPNQYKYEEVTNNYKLINGKRQITILEATTVFGQPKFCTKEEQKIFHPACPFTNCLWKCSKEDKTVTQLDALIFHHLDINSEEIQKFLDKRTLNEIYILWIDEAHKNLQHLNEYKFNWTLSFRQDSEISIATYGLIVKLQRHKQEEQHSNNETFIPYMLDKHSHLFTNILLNHSLITVNKELEQRILTNYRFRKKQALWFVSNCKPKKRLEYYEQLKKYFVIDAEGSCIKLDEQNLSIKQCGKSEQCEKDQLYLSMFYLAFESQSCTDYVTEKLWRALYHGMIPIIMGPKKQHYLDLNIPSTAFIHVDDYSSEKQLAIRLHEISQNYFEYRKYFLWQTQYTIFYKPEDLEPLRMCELCMKLNLNTKYRYYQNLQDWHNQGC